MKAAIPWSNITRFFIKLMSDNVTMLLTPDSQAPCSHNILQNEMIIFLSKLF